MPPAPSPNATRDLSTLRIDRAAEPPRRGMPGWLVALLAITGIAAVAVAVTLVLGRGARGREVSVGTAILERATAGGEPVLAATGYVVARTKAAVSAKIPGRLERLDVEEGSRVEAGAIIAVLESDALVADVEAAAASVEQAEASLVRARADRDIARVERDRQASLLSAQLGTRSASESAEALLASRQAAVAEADGGLRAARARLEQSRVGLENANVRAPFSGVVLRKEAEVGEYVAPSVSSGSLTRGAIVTMADLASLEVEADVAEGNVARLLDGMAAEIALDAVPDRRYSGRLRQVMPTADRQKATVQVKVALLDPDERVKPEMSAKVRFLSQAPDPRTLQEPPVVTAPASAVLVAPAGGAAAFVVTPDGRARRVAIAVGERRGDRVVIESGLSGGEALVLNPPPSLQDGASVEVQGP